MNTKISQKLNLEKITDLIKSFTTSKNFCNINNTHFIPLKDLSKAFALYEK